MRRHKHKMKTQVQSTDTTLISVVQRQERNGTLLNLSQANIFHKGVTDLNALLCLSESQLRERRAFKHREPQSIVLQLYYLYDFPKLDKIGHGNTLKVYHTPLKSATWYKCLLQKCTILTVRNRLCSKLTLLIPTSILMLTVMLSQCYTFASFPM